MKVNDEIIDDLIDEGEFFDYVDFIDHCWKKLYADNRLLRFEDFIMNHGRNKEIKRVSINKEEEEKNETTTRKSASTFGDYNENEEEELNDDYSVKMFESFKKASLKVSVLDELLDDEKAKEEVKKED